MHVWPTRLKPPRALKGAPISKNERVLILKRGVDCFQKKRENFFGFSGAPFTRATKLVRCRRPLRSGPHLRSRGAARATPQELRGDAQMPRLRPRGRAAVLSIPPHHIRTPSHSLDERLTLRFYRVFFIIFIFTPAVEGCETPFGFLRREFLRCGGGVSASRRPVP